MQGKHMGHTSTGKHRVLGKPQGVAARAAGQAGGLAGGCSEHVSHWSRLGMEGIHRAETSRRRRRAELVPCPCDAAQISCRQVVTATSPMLPTSPAPPSRSNAPMCRQGKLRPRHPLSHRDHAHHPFLVAANKTRPGSTGKVPCRHSRCRETRARGIRVHGSIYRKFEPVMASAVCAGRARPPRITTLPSCEAGCESAGALHATCKD